MKKIIMVRHGESVTNVSRVFTGQLDVPLTETGREQARRMAEYMDKYHVDKMYASPLERALDTAKAIAARQNCQIETVDALMEINAGSWHGLPFEEIAEKFPETYQVWRADIGSAVTADGESCRQLYDRVTGFFEKVLQEPEETVCLVCHATPIRMIESHIEAGSVKVAQQIPWVPNASVTVYEYDGAFHVVERGTSHYMKDLISTLPTTI